MADFLNQAPRFYWYPNESFLKIWAGAYDAFSTRKAFGECIGDRFGESRTENSYSPGALPEVTNLYCIMGNSQAAFTIIHPHAAGIDVGSRTHLVAIDQNKDNVREFGVYTKNHQEMISHLHQHGVTTIAMESTGSYWQTLFNALQQAGFDVLLVGGSQTKNVKRGGPCRSKNRCHRLHLDSESDRRLGCTRLVCCRAVYS